MLLDEKVPVPRPSRAVQAREQWKVNASEWTDARHQGLSRPLGCLCSLSDVQVEIFGCLPFSEHCLRGRSMIFVARVNAGVNGCRGIRRHGSVCGHPCRSLRLVNARILATVTASSIIFIVTYVYTVNHTGKCVGRNERGTSGGWRGQHCFRRECSM